MAQSISIDDLTFGQVALGTDSLVIEYCNSKSEKKNNFYTCVEIVSTEIHISGLRLNT